MATKKVTLLDAIIDVLAFSSNDHSFEGTATELLELVNDSMAARIEMASWNGKIAPGFCDELPADALGLSEALSGLEPRLKELGVTVNRFKKGEQRTLRVALIPGFYDDVS